MMTGMVQVRHPYNIKKAREQTEAYLKQLADLSSPFLEMYKGPAGSYSKQRDDIPYFFAWSLLEGKHPGDHQEGYEEAKGAEAVTTTTTAPTAAGGMDGSATRAVTFNLPEATRSSSSSTAPVPGVVVEREETNTAATPASSSPMRSKIRPYKPLFAQRKAGLAPKVGEAAAVPDLTIPKVATAAKEEEKEGEEEQAAEEFTSEYQRAFVWPDVSDVFRAKPLQDKYQPSTIFAKDDIDLVLRKRRSSPGSSRADDHLWSLLTTDIPIPSASYAAPAISGLRPDTDQLWDLLEPDLPQPPLPEAEQQEPALLTVESKDDEEEERAHGVVARPDFTTGLTADSQKERRRGRKHKKEMEEEQAAAAAQLVGGVEDTKRRSLATRRRRKRAIKPSGYHTFNPILLNPRYPQLRPGKEVFSTEYSSRFIWPTAPSLLTPL